MITINTRDLRIVLRDTGEILRVLAVIMLIPLLVTLYYNPSILPMMSFIVPSALFFTLSAFFRSVYWKSRGDRESEVTTLKHAMMTVAFAWLIVALIGSLPFSITGTLNPLDSFFESMSGWTTAGMTMIQDIENLNNEHKDVLFYRSLMEWVGGVGIIVLFLVILMRPGSEAQRLYSSEARLTRIKPRMKSTAIEIWKIYALYTLMCAVLLSIAGMTPFDAINHSLTTLSTGGFSTHDESIAYYDSHPNGLLIKVILMFFMIVGAISFMMHFKVFQGNHKELFRNPEFRAMLVIIFIVGVIITAGLYFSGYNKSGENTAHAIINPLFQVVALLTPTGYTTMDISGLGDLPKTALLLIMFVGGCYGSTTGGIKLLRLIIIVKAIWHSIKKVTLPETAVISLKLDGKVLENKVVVSAMVLVILYIILAVAGATAFMAMGIGDNPYDSLSLSISSLSNVGPTFLSEEEWFSMPDDAKLLIIFLIWAGRIEIFPVVILLTHITKRKDKR